MSWHCLNQVLGLLWLCNYLLRFGGWWRWWQRRKFLELNDHLLCSTFLRQLLTASISVGRQVTTSALRHVCSHVCRTRLFDKLFHIPRYDKNQQHPGRQSRQHFVATCIFAKSQRKTKIFLSTECSKCWCNPRQQKCGMRKSANKGEKDCVGGSIGISANGPLVSVSFTALTLTAG